MRIENATIQAKDIFCNPMSLFDEQELRLFNICTTFFLYLIYGCSVQEVNAFHFFSFFFLNKVYQSQAMDQILVLN